MRSSTGSRWKTAAAGLVGGLALRRLAGERYALKGKTVLITGGSRGLGLLLARRFGEFGARVAICARDGAELERAERELASEGIDCFAFVCDVTRSEELKLLVTAVVAHFGALDVLVNNASIIQVGPAEVMNLADFHAALDANFWGSVHATFAAMPELAKRKGRIVNISSIGGVVAIPHLLPYTAAKFALTGFSTGFRAEAAKQGVCVTTIVPGLMRTGSFLHALVKGKRAEETEWFTLGASLPILSINAERAARRIVTACVRGEAFVTLGLPAKALRMAQALAPGLTSTALEAVNRLLPGPGAERRSARPTPGYKHRKAASNSFLTMLGDRAAAENNEQYPIAPERLH